MTQTLIEKLETFLTLHEAVTASDFRPQVKVVSQDDLRAIIEDAKAEKQEPFGYVSGTTYSVTDAGTVRKTPNDVFKNPVYTTPQPDIVAELVKALEETVAIAEAHIAGLNCTGPKALIAKAKEMMG